MSDALIRQGQVAEILNEMGSGFADDVADMIKNEGRSTVYNAVVSSQFDADRLDYMRRDRLMTGTHHAGIDFEWLIANLQIAPVPIGIDDEQTGTIETFTIGPKAIHAAEAFVLGLFQLYPTVYFHKATRGAEKLFTELLVRTVELIQSGQWEETGLPQKHPLALFANSPDDIESALNLDDTVVWGALPMLSSSNDPLISEFAKRLRDRNLYKCMDIRAVVAHTFDPGSSNEPALLAKIDRCCANINEKLKSWREQSRDPVPRLLIDEAERSPYKTGGGSKGPAEQINVRTDGGEVVDLKSRSRVVASLSSFKLLRAYHSESDTEIREMIRTTVEGETAACR